jgi:microcystin-dependent protein
VADSDTAHWGLTKPEIGSSRDTWGAKLNADWDSVDAIMAALTPIGAVTDFAGAAAPDGWLLCDGTIYPIASYPKLAAVLGRTYGGDGVTTFAVPDARARVSVGVGSTTDSGGQDGTFALGVRAGWFYQTLNATYLPAVAVTIDAGGDHSHTGYTDFQGLHGHGGSTDAQGDHAHSVSDRGASGGGGTTGAFPIYSTGFSFQGATTDTRGSHAHNIGTTTDGSHQHNVQTYGSGPHTHTGRIAGSGNPLPVYQPSIGFNKIIFAGPPGFTALSSPIPGAPALLRSPMRGVG